MLKLDNLQIQKIIEQYLCGKSGIQLAKDFNISEGTIYNYLKKYNISTRKRKYELNEKYFDEINTPEKAYFLGILYADGCNSTEINLVRLVLSQIDECILLKLRKEIFPNDDIPLHFRKSRINKFKDKEFISEPSLSLNINSKHISEKLNDFGLYKSKTFKIEFPKWIDTTLLRHFIRGYFDGDGSLSFTKAKQISISILGTKSFCDDLKNILSKNNIKSSICHAKKSSIIKQLSIHGNRVGKKFLDFIYNDSTIGLKRKYDKFLSIIPYLPPYYTHCVLCEEKHESGGYCKKHYYELIGREKRKQRYKKTKA